MHRKCPRGHRALPMCEQGRHLSMSCSTTVLTVPVGKKPSCRVVDPKIATRGRLRAAATCIRPVSFVITNAHESINAAVSASEHFPANTATSVSGAWALIIAAITLQRKDSSSDPKIMICACCWRLSSAAIAAYRSAGHIFVKWRAIGQMPT